MFNLVAGPIPIWQATSPSVQSGCRFQAGAQFSLLPIGFTHPYITARLNEHVPIQFIILTRILPGSDSITCLRAPNPDSREPTELKHLYPLQLRSKEFLYALSWILALYPELSDSRLSIR